MLNRRLLRIKVMQSLYALKQSEEANYNNAIAYIEEIFLPDLNANEKQDLKKLEEYKSKAKHHFEKFFQEEFYTAFEKEAQEVNAGVKDAISFYHKQVEKDKKHFGKLLSKEVEGIYESYLIILELLVELAQYNLDDEEDKDRKYWTAKPVSISDQKWRENVVIQSIKNNKDFISNTSKNKAVWDAEALRKIYKDLKADKIFQEYLTTEENSIEADKNIVLHVVKTLVFKGVYLQSFFEERELNWVENKSIVKNMVLKTIKAFGEKEEIKILALSSNWEDDKQFYEELYSKTVEKDKELEALTSEKIKNWDIERLATLDRIILMMAVSEMIEFPSIPVKVSINEYIELSKLYSTPKSKQFVNGLLDKLSEDLVKRGIIRKSGRGLIDNK